MTYSVGCIYRLRRETSRSRCPTEQRGVVNGKAIQKPSGNSEFSTVDSYNPTLPQSCTSLDVPRAWSARTNLGIGIVLFTPEVVDFVCRII